ncbi:hypothetical protein [Actinoallomurus sp. CA-150999]|uniref:hypothetical protein n=1 Tax=Actinoallomurus sp. CA-150999 TaxID=3239887 RepID=UPI003D91BE7C
MRRILIFCTVAGMLASATACGGGSKAKDDPASASPSEKAAGSGGGAKKSGEPKSKPAGGAHEVVLEVLGSGELSGILYNAGGNGSASNVKLPWKKTAKVKGGLLAVLANAPSQQKITCQITVDGSVVTKKTGMVAQCRYMLKK